MKSCLLTPVRPLISNYSGQDILLLDQQKGFLNSTNGETLPLFSYWPKPKLCTLFWACNNRSTLKLPQVGLDPLRFIYKALHLSRRYSICAVKGGAYPSPLPPRTIPLLDPSLFFLSKSSLHCILLDAQIDLLRTEASPTSIILV